MTFAADGMLGRLAKWLRALGYDTILVRSMDVDEAQRLLSQERTILTRNHRLRKALPEDRLVFIHSDHLEEQLAQLFREGWLSLDRRRTFRRCIRCNQPLKRISRAQAEDLVPEYVFNSQPHFHVCPGCGRVYWPGTHRRNMTEALERIVRQSSPQGKSTPGPKPPGSTPQTPEPAGPAL